MAVTAEQKINFKGTGKLHAFPVASGQTIYGGTLAVVSNDGYLYNLSSTTAPKARIVCLVADENASSTLSPAATTSNGSISGTYEIKSDVAGDKTVRNVYLDGEVELTFTAIAQSDVGKTVYASDNYTLDESMNSSVKVGTLKTYISATSGWVLLNSFFQADGAIAYKLALTKATTTAVGGVLSWQNPFGESIMVEKFIIDITGASTTAATTIDFGTGSATASRDNLIDGINVATLAPRVADNTVDGGTNGKGARKMSSTDYIIGTTSAALTASFAGTAMIIYRVWE